MASSFFAARGWRRSGGERRTPALAGAPRDAPAGDLGDRGRKSAKRGVHLSELASYLHGAPPHGDPPGFRRGAPDQMPFGSWVLMDSIESQQRAADAFTD